MTRRAWVAGAAVVLAAFMAGVIVGDSEEYAYQRWKRVDPVEWHTKDSVEHYTDRVWDIAWQPECFVENEELREVAERLSSFVFLAAQHPDSALYRMLQEASAGLDSLMPQ